MIRCKGITLKKTQCKLFHKSGYCRYHKKQEIKNIVKQEHKEGSEICCICLDEDNFPNPLKECNHFIHHSCIWKSGTNLCPICRREIVLSKNQHKKMKNRAEKFKSERIEEEREEIISNQIREEVRRERFENNIRHMFDIFSDDIIFI